MPDRRSAKIELRCTPVEKARILERALAAGLKTSDYVRRRALCEPLPGVAGGGAPAGGADDGR